MAKQLGIGPRSLIKNIPSPGQRWKRPVKEWVRHLYAKKFGKQNAHRDATKTSPALRDDNGTPSRALMTKPELGLVDPNSDIDIPF
ncbi:MAG: hypothetical protein WB586_00905 [Chthoniobacterales bacterium]